MYIFIFRPQRENVFSKFTGRGCLDPRANMECQADMPGNATVVIFCVLVHAIANNNVFNLCLFADAMSHFCMFS